MKYVIPYFVAIILFTCICYFGPIKQDEPHYDYTIIQTYEVKILHLDIDTVSDTEKRYYASVIDKANDISIIIEIPEAQYVKLRIDDIIELQKETFYNDDIETIRYSIVGEPIRIETSTLGW